MARIPLLIAGVDEVGRGPLAGAVVAAAVILPENHDLPGLTDSKKLSAKRREQLATLIQQQAIAYAYGRAEVEEIDNINILQASLLAMSRAVASLTTSPTNVLVDGRHCPEMTCPVEGIIGGDSTVPAISAASILAKVSRDAEMRGHHQEYPQYNFAKHKGYGTAEHLRQLKQHGPCPLHRRSFRPVRECL